VKTFLSFLLCILGLCVIRAYPDDANPFANIHFEQLQFNIPDGKVIVLKNDGTVHWPKGVPSAEVQAFCDQLVCEKETDIATISARPNQTALGSLKGQKVEPTEAPPYGIPDAVADWNAIVQKLAMDGRLDGDDAEQAQAMWKVIKTLFPQCYPQ
jgi:hypothetical protein